MTICHETPSGQRNTLILPRNAALNHLLQHPLDTIGACELPVTLEDETPPKEPAKEKKGPKKSLLSKVKGK